uniref:Hamartin n=1 Tax=Ditylenchus dipsaci TaxID=166011 RepID=A0A915CTY9_9BILA
MDNSSSISTDIRSLESLDTHSSKTAIADFQSWISEGVAIAQLVEHYASSQSIRALELLCLVQEPHDNILLDKMLESIAQSPQGTLILLGRLVQKAPSWIPKLPHHRIFRIITELIRMENDLEIVIAAMMFITSVLPFSSTLNEHLFNEIFNAFLEACRIFAHNQAISKNYHSLSKQNKPSENKAMLQCKSSIAGGPTQPSLSHQVSSKFEALVHQCTMNTMKSTLVKFFQTFYAIWPCNLIHMLKEFSVNNKQNNTWDVIKQMLMSVRLHPSLIFDTRAKELSRDRWMMAAAPNDDETEEGFFELHDEEKGIEQEDDGNCSDHSFRGDFEQNLDGFFTVQETKHDTNTFHPTSDYTNSSSTHIDIGLGQALDSTPLQPNPVYCRSVERRILTLLDNENNLPQQVDSAEECMGSMESLTASRNHHADLEKEPSTKEQDYKETILAGPSGVQCPTTANDCCKGQDDIECFQKPSTSNHSSNKQLLRKASSSMSHLEKLNSYYNVIEESTKLPLFPPAQSRLQSKSNNCKPDKKESYAKQIKPNAKHHQALKQLGLADRVPGKMYDDMQPILKGLSVDKQCELLSTRLRLKSPPIRPTQPKRSYLAECERLKKSEHQSFVELDQQVQSCKKLRLEIAHKTKTIAANEAHFNTVLGGLNKEKEALFEKMAEVGANQLDKARRHNDDLMAERRLIDQELKAFDELRVEFARLQKEKLYLEEELTRMTEECSKPSANSSIHSIHQTEYIVPYYETQLKTLRAQCRKHKCLMQQANDRVKLMEVQSKEEMDRRMELQAILHRVSMVNSKQAEASQHKFNSILAISNKQEAHIFNLYRFLEENQQL